MMHTISDPFESVIRDSGEGWILDSYHPRDRAMEHLHALLRRADARSREKLGSTGTPITPEVLVDQYRGNPHKVRAFLQALGSIESPEMLLMAWRILEGAEVTALRVEYSFQKSFYLHVELRAELDQGTESYDSQEIEDAAALRHLGIMRIDGKPIFEGFYALRLS